MVPAKAPDFPKRRNKTVGNDRNCLAPTTEAATASASSSRETSTTGSSSSTSAASGGATSHSTAARCTSATSRSTTGSTLGNTAPLGLCGTCNYVRYKRITDREGKGFVPGGGLGLGRNLKVDPLAKQFKKKGHVETENIAYFSNGRSLSPPMNTLSPGLKEVATIPS